MAAVTCAEVRELFSARADEALAAGERARLDDHLATCGDCAREWRRFEATVGLLRAVESPRAPAGFVDRVLAARPRPWYRRLARGLLVPWTVKLPLEAAAVVLLAGLAVVVFQRSPDLQQVARAPETRESFHEAPASGERAAPAAPSAARGWPLSSEREAGQGLLDRLEPPAPAAGRRDAPGPEGGAAAGQPGTAPPAAEPEPSREAFADLRAKETAPLAELRRQRAAEGVPPTAPAAPAPPGATAKAEGPTARISGLGAPADVQARLAAPDRAAAEREVRAVVARVGGVVTTSGAESLQIVVPRAAWAGLVGELERLGTLRIESQAAALPPAVRLRLRLE